MSALIPPDDSAKEPGPFKMPACPLCQRSDLTPCKTVLDGPYRLLYCRSCDLEFAHPMQHPGRDFYERLSPIYSYRRQYHTHRLELFASQRDFLRRLPAQGGQLLDVGCGDGLFLNCARSHYRVAGLELDREAAAIARARLPADTPIYEVGLDALRELVEDGTLDVITCFEVLEHLADPAAFFQQASRLLKSGGYLAVSVPNRDRHYGRSNPHDFPPNHLTRWTHRGLQLEFERHGIETIVAHHLLEGPFGAYEWPRILSLGLFKGTQALGGVPTDKVIAKPPSRIQRLIWLAKLLSIPPLARLWQLALRRRESLFLYVLGRKRG